MAEAAEAPVDGQSGEHGGWEELLARVLLYELAAEVAAEELAAARGEILSMSSDDDEAPEGSEAVVGELVRAGFALGDVGEALDVAGTALSWWRDGLNDLWNVAAGCRCASSSVPPQGELQSGWHHTD